MNTPLQTALKYIPLSFGNNNQITQANLKKFLTSFLQAEKEFARSVWEAGERHEYVNNFLAAPATEPDFLTYWKQFETKNNL